VKFRPYERPYALAAFQAQRKRTRFAFDADFEREEGAAFHFVCNPFSYFS
jgi:hypothetical protein